MQPVQPAQPAKLYIATGRAGNLAQKLTTRCNCKACESCDRERQERRGLLFLQLLSYAVVRGGGGGAHLHLTNQLERMGGGPQPSWQKGRRRGGIGCLPACRFHAIPNIDKCPHQLSTPLLGNCEKLFGRGDSQQI